MRLADKVAIVTGAGSGIGKATALLFAKEGARVVVADINLENGEKTVAVINEADGKAHFIPVDVTRPNQVEEMVGRTVETFGRVDILVNCAGILHMSPADKTSDENWRAVLAVNLDGLFFCSRAAIPPMRRQRGGCIVNIASGAGLAGVPNSPAYCASKGGVVLLTKQMAIDFAEDNIRINAICPGAVNTGFMQYKFEYDHPEDPDGYRREYNASLPLGRMLYPEEVAHQALFLASHKSYLLTGHCVVI